MLDAFIRVINSDTALQFARNFGILGLCKHGSQHHHSRACLVASRGIGWDQPGVESLSHWFHYAQYARRILSLAASIYSNETGSKDDWRFLYKAQGGKGSLDELFKALENRPSLGKNLITSAINQWLDSGNVRPTISWTGLIDSKAAFSLSSGTFGSIGIQLMSAVARIQNIYFCDGCGTPYPRQRKPQSNRNQYCPKCGEPVASRNRQRNYRRQAKA